MQQTAIKLGKVGLIILAIPIVLYLMVITTSLAHGAGGPPKHFYVCKYVGQPGPNERLQTGQNPLNVPDPHDELKVGTGWTDAQGSSYVLAEVTGQPEPKCPDNSDGTNDPVDVCPNIDGDQATIPANHKLEGKNCIEQDAGDYTDPKPPVECKIGRVVHYNDPETKQDPVCKDEVENTTPTPVTTEETEVFYGK